MKIIVYQQIDFSILVKKNKERESHLHPHFTPSSELPAFQPHKFIHGFRFLCILWRRFLCTPFVFSHDFGILGSLTYAHEDQRNRYKTLQIENFKEREFFTFCGRCFYVYFIGFPPLSLCFICWDTYKVVLTVFNQIELF